MLNFSEILCKNIVFRKIMTSDIEDIRLVRQRGESEGSLSKTSADIGVFSKWLDTEFLNPRTLYLAILDTDRNFIGTIRLIDLNGETFEWGSWALKSGLGSLISLNSAYAVYKVALELCGFNSAEFVVKSHNKNVINFHLQSGAKIVNYDTDSTFFRFDSESIHIFLDRFENKFGSLFLFK